MRPQLFHGAVLHARLRPLRNAFRYRVFFLRFALSELHRLDNAVFSINRWNLFSFHYRDHGARDGSHPESWIRALLAQEDLKEADGEIWLQAFPRIIRGVSHLRFGDDGKVTYHRDYWYTGEELYGKLPLIGGAVRFLRGAIG